MSIQNAPAARPLSAVLGLLLAASGLAQSPNWSSPSVLPGVRSHHAMAYDTARGKTVLFGGYRPGTNALGDTWEWDGYGWSQRTPAQSPPARSMHVMAFDRTRGVTVLFGGLGTSWLNDTWEWDGVNWRQVLTANAPPAPLEKPAMAWHGGTNPGCVLFGGLGAATFSSQTWQYDGTDWTQRAAFGPVGRYLHAMAYAPNTQRTYLYGGRTSHNGYAAYDMWAWDGNTWSIVTQYSSPLYLCGHSMTFDEGRNELVMVGGSDGNAGGPIGLPNEYTYWALVGLNPQVPFGHTALWVNQPWNYDAALGRYVPTRHVNGAMAFDTVRRTIVAFGGQAIDGTGLGTHLDFTWEVPPGGIYSLPWVERLRVGGPASNPAPSARVYTEMAYDPGFGHSVLYGGWNGLNVLDDTWTFDGTRWTNHGPGSPGPRLQPAMCWTPWLGTVMFGGASGFGGPYYTDTVSWGGSGWFATLTSGAPAGRYGHDMVFDAVRNRVVMFGGYGQSGTLGTTHELRPNTQFTYLWSTIATNGTPPARNAHRMAYDSRRQRTVMFGGADAGGQFLGDTWEYDGATATWTQVFPPVSPPRRWNHVMEYDPGRGVVVMSGGYGNPQCGNYCASFLSDVWEYNGVTWTQRATGTTTPSGREGAGFAFDTARQRFVLQGGSGNSAYPTETWLYQAPIDRFAPGMASGDDRIRCSAFPVAGGTAAYSFPAPLGLGILLIALQPQPNLLLTLTAPFTCVDSYLYAFPFEYVLAVGLPEATVQTPIPPGLVGFGAVVQGMTLDATGTCWTMTSPLAITVQAP